MTRDEVVQIVKEEMPQIIVNQLTSQGIKDNEVYLINVEVGDSPIEKVQNTLNLIKDNLKKIGLNKFVLVPMYNGKLKVKVKVIETTELDNYEEINI